MPNLAYNKVFIISCSMQNIVRMNKTEDDEMAAGELTEDELRQMAGNVIVNIFFFQSLLQ